MNQLKRKEPARNKCQNGDCNNGVTKLDVVICDECDKPTSWYHCNNCSSNILDDVLCMVLTTVEISANDMENDSIYGYCGCMKANEELISTQ